MIDTIVYTMLVAVREWSLNAVDVLSEELSTTLPVSVITDWVVSILLCVGMNPNANMSELAKIMIGIIKPNNLLSFFDKAPLLQMGGDYSLIYYV